MKCKNAMIQNDLGMHARASAKFVSLASTFSAEITIAKNGKKMSGKSIMGIMMLAAAKGSEITICADGEDEDKAIDNLWALVEDYFGEEI